MASATLGSIHLDSAFFWSSSTGKSNNSSKAFKLSLSSGKLILSVTNPDSGSATEEIEVDYDGDPIDIGFNSRYLLDIAAQLDGEVAVLRLADPGPPTLIELSTTKER